MIKLGKIKEVYFGKGGYQESEIGIYFTLGGDSWEVCDWRGTWAMERSEYAKWTEEERIRALGETVMFINKLLEISGVNKVQDLKNVPVEVTFDGTALKEWRILKEVL